jgi:hypothetical protein
VLKQQMLKTVYPLPTQENKLMFFLFPFAANKRKFVVFVYGLQQTNGN